MNLAEDCLRYLQDRNWIELNKVLSDNDRAKEIAQSPTFSIFEIYLIDELRRHEEETNEDQIAVAATIFQIHQNKKSTLTLSKNVVVNLAKFLFNKTRDEVYAKILTDDADAQAFLTENEQKRQEIIKNTLISASINVKIGEHGKLKFDKDIFNGSPQEKELYIAAKKVFPRSILLPNTALKTIIDSKVCEFLDDETAKFFHKSTLDLCIVNPSSFMPKIFIELDSGWHDKPKQIANDRMKDEIFEKAGLRLDRIRKIRNNEMSEIFELYLKQNFDPSNP